MPYNTPNEIEHTFVNFGLLVYGPYSPLNMLELGRTRGIPLSWRLGQEHLCREAMGDQNPSNN